MMEILIVLAIMAVLATLVGPTLFNQLDKSKVTAARTQIRTLESALSTFRLDVGRFPTEEEGLAVLVQPPQDEETRQLWSGPYLDGDVPADPWGRTYHYALAAVPFDGAVSKPVVFSYGADGKPGGKGLDADLGRIDQLKSTTGVQ
ncbi:MAG: type II secretion system major pseudopilin GspG [Hyphomonas sp.]|nr:type II secretion system major pseudopilin GspG [Hyphomonas sp.]